jgi:1-acyl-sn-glycerol-3-phosphate acyltransferase
LAYQLRLTTDIRQSLPGHKSFDKLLDLIESSSGRDVLFIAFQPTENDQTDSIWSRIEEKIALFVSGSANDLGSNILDPGILYSKIPGMLLPKDYDELDSLISNTSAEQALLNGIENLNTPQSWLSPISFNKDPYDISQIGFDYLKKSEPLSPVVFDENGMNLRTGELVNAYKLNPSNNQDDKTDLLSNLNTLSEELEVEQVELLFFSPVLVEAGNVLQVRKDIGVTMVIAIICVLLLLVVTYRGIRTPILFLLPGGFGLLFSLSLLTLFNGEVIGIAVGAGSVIFGIVLDYSFHFFTHYRKTGDLSITLREVANPLLTSCLTTVLAFGLLIFTGSPILRDFGLFASLSLIGSALGVIFILPVFLPRNMEPIMVKWKMPTFSSKWLNRVGVVAIIIVSIIMIGKVDEASFDADLDNLNYYPEDLKKSEHAFSGIVAGEEKRLFLEFVGEDDNVLEEANTILTSFTSTGAVKGYLLQDLLNPSADQWEQRQDRWLNFWKDRSDSLNIALKVAGESFGFSPTAFSDFHSWTKSGQKQPAQNEAMSFLVVEKDSLETVKEELNLIHGVEVIDMRAGSQSMVEAVRDDFNFILIGSSLLVFLVLLLVYGRIELTVITFLPMALSWVWIVGATSMFGIEFNFVNVILSTFIFGLGDDFAIFISDGYLNRYKYGRNALASNRMAIGLSATTTLIGMGALMFAEHPAIQSISRMSIIGIIIILLMSLFLQPLLYKALITNRTNKGNPPLTLVNIIFTIVTFGQFIIVSISMVLLQFVLRVLPFKKARKQRWLRKLFQVGCQFILHSGLNVRKRRFGRENLDLSEPCVIVVNHQSFIDILQMISLSPNIVIMTKKWVYQSPLFGAAVRYAGYLYAAEGAEINEDRIRENLDQGNSIVIFPEGTRSKEGKSTRWHKGAFFLSEQLNIPVLPVLLHGYGHAIAKNDFILTNGCLSHTVLPKIHPDNTDFGTGYRERTKAISRWHRQKYVEFADEYAKTDYYYTRIAYTFIYKNPVTEWYFRIKWRFERENFERYDELLPNSGKIYDLGCGLGYSSLYLHLRQDKREIVAMDYDQDKITAAQNHYLNGDNIRFEHGDIRNLSLEPAAGILISDVLHYLAPDDQLKVLRTCAESLIDGGVLLVRDGLRDESEGHRFTAKTEKWSTKLIQFNKTDVPLHFFDREFIETFARETGLDCELIWKSTKSSNALFLLKNSGSN